MCDMIWCDMGSSGRHLAFFPYAEVAGPRENISQWTNKKKSQQKWHKLRRRPHSIPGWWPKKAFLNDWKKKKKADKKKSLNL